MRVIIAGGRDFDDYEYACEELDYFFNLLATVPMVVSGGARGADRIGEKYAIDNEMKMRQFPAEWDKYGKSAGYRRNVDMANFSEALVAFWDGKSKGTKHMIDIAIEKGLLVQVVRYTK
jgi:hypothetical protein